MRDAGSTNFSTAIKAELVPEKFVLVLLKNTVLRYGWLLFRKMGTYFGWYIAHAKIVCP